MTSIPAFVSYSHRDHAVVGPVICLLRIGRDVFLDRDSIRPGQRWRDAISEAIKASSHFLLFWSSHSATSEEVVTEYDLAIGHAKDIVPVLLDSTPLPSPLTEYQWVDFQSFIAPPPSYREGFMGVPPLFDPDDLNKPSLEAFHRLRSRLAI